MLPTALDPKLPQKGPPINGSVPKLPLKDHPKALHTATTQLAIWRALMEGKTINCIGAIGPHRPIMQPPPIGHPGGPQSANFAVTYNITH